MKSLLSFLTLLTFSNFIFCSASLAASSSQKVKALEFVAKHRLYFTAYELMKELAAENAKGADWNKVQSVFSGVHPSVFIHDKDLDKFSRLSTPLDYAVGMRLFFQGKYDLSEKRLSGLRKGHPMFVERSYLRGLISLIQGQSKDAATFFSSCIRGFQDSSSSKGKPEGYMRMFRNRCIQQLSRVLFAENRHADSLRILGAIHKTDFIWPNTLLERAWSHYYLEQRPLALGILTSFKAPILQRYMTPEAEYLKSLIYFEMCYFDRAKEVAKEFQDITWKNRTYFQRVNGSQLLKLAFMKNPPNSPKARALYYYLKSFKKDIRHTSFLRSLSQIKRELKALKLFKKMPGKAKLVAKIKNRRAIMISDHKELLENMVADYHRQILRTKQHFVKLNLMLSLQERKHLRAGTNSSPYSQDLVEMDLEGIGNVDNKFIWNFIGGFWADELGDYAVALEDRCKEN